MTSKTNKKNIEHLTSLDVIRLLKDRRATFSDYGEGIGKLLKYKNKVYYQEGDKFYVSHECKGGKKLKNE